MGVVGRKVIDTQNMKSSLYGWGINDYDGVVSQRINGKKVIDPYYSRWISVVQRGNDPKEKARKPSYADVYVSEKWRHFTDFRAWLDTQPYWKELYLDKDILVNNNKEYGPDTCCLVPLYLNMITINGGKQDGQYPTGVSVTPFKKFTARCGDVRLGNYSTPQEAHKAWQWEKAKQIENAVNKYSSEPWFRTDVADALMSKVWKLRLNSVNGLITTYI